MRESRFHRVHREGTAETLFDLGFVGLHRNPLLCFGFGPIGIKRNPRRDLIGQYF
jgi:hypothetical protein